MESDTAKSLKTRVIDKVCYAIAAGSQEIEIEYLQCAQDALEEIIEDMSMEVERLKEAA